VVVEIRSVEGEIVDNGEVSVVGIVRRRYGWRRGLRPGDRARFPVCVLEHEHSPMPRGGARWLALAKVEPGALIEVYLDGDPPNLVPALWQYELVDRPGPKPVMRWWHHPLG
jgi:hypothetical protein